MSTFLCTDVCVCVCVCVCVWERERGCRPHSCQSKSICHKDKMTTLLDENIIKFPFPANEHINLKRKQTFTPYFHMQNVLCDDVCVWMEHLGYLNHAQCVCQCAPGVLQWPMSFKWKSVSTYNTLQYFLWKWRLHMWCACVSMGWRNSVMFITDNDNRDVSEHTSAEAAGHRFIMTPEHQHLTTTPNHPSSS